jgi:hypothetical protein
MIHRMYQEDASKSHPCLLFNFLLQTDPLGKILQIAEVHAHAALFGVYGFLAQAGVRFFI